MTTSLGTFRRGFARIARGAVIGCFALLVFAGAAEAGSWASVNYDGSLLKSRGVLANYRDGTGLYRIVFRKKLDNCVPIVSLRGAYGFIRADVTGNPGEVAIQLANDNLSNFIDGSFNITLAC